ncbi:hypothetical protein ACFLV6_03810 [Chloroflexota bacterium]
MQKQLSKEKPYRYLFLIAALYDFILGSVFFIFTDFIFDHILNIPLPTYPAFYQAAAAFVFAMGVGFYFVYLNIYRNIDIVKLGIVFKLFYTGVAFYYVFVENMPWVFSVFGLLDLIFIVFFVFFLLAIRREVKM